MWMFVCVSYNLSYRNILDIKISDFPCQIDIEVASIKKPRKFVCDSPLCTYIFGVVCCFVSNYELKSIHWNNPCEDFFKTLNNTQIFGVLRKLI